MSGKRRTPAERSIIFGSILGAKSLDEVNALLASVHARPLPKSSYDSVKRAYNPYFEHDLTRLGRAIDRPPTWAELGTPGSGDIDEEL